MGLPEIAVDVRPDMDPRNAGGIIASASGECPGCRSTVTRTAHGRCAPSERARATAAIALGVRRSIEDAVINGCPMCQLLAQGWTFAARQRLEVAR